MSNILSRLRSLCEAEAMTKEDEERISAASKGSKEALKFAQQKDRKFNPVTYAAMKDDKEREEYAKTVPGTVKALTSKKNECKGVCSKGKKPTQKKPKNQFFRKGKSRKNECGKTCSAKNESRLIKWFNKCYSTDSSIQGSASMHEQKIKTNGAIRFFTKKPNGGVK